MAVDDYSIGEDANEWNEDEAWLAGPLGREMVFLRVPEAKTVKNSAHVCLRPVDTDRDAEVERLLGLGASMVNDLRNRDQGWAVLADPEGNEFCVLTRTASACGITRGS
ncbi:VOC family protein [Bowdeniella nasicola]|uniref:VOC family protein n=1 Tax=Bowdeniella nasicola TaxID=208480 RepID=UPI001C9E38B1|nr:VOC family protein [Bowdeniella nasicola]